MKKVIKNIPVFFMLLAGLAISAHMIIPHDHHLIESASGNEDTCPASKSRTGHHSGLPVHCHAFNDLASEKAIIFTLIKNLHSSGLTTGALSDASRLSYGEITVTDINEPFRDSCFPDFSFLRAPPA